MSGIELKICKECKEEKFIFEVATDICIECYFKINMPKPKKRSKWKLLGYLFLFYFIPTIVIALIFGVKVECIAVVFFIWGMYFPDIIDWLMEKF